MNAASHDFTRPTRLSTAWHGRLTTWCRTSLTLATKAWAKELPVALEASIRNLEVDYAPQALTRLGEGFIGHQVKVAGDGVPTFLVLPRKLVLDLVGVLLGESAADKDRELTLVEENLAEFFLAQHWLTYFRNAWPAAPAVSWILEAGEQNPHCSKCFPAGDVLVTLEWQIKGPWGETTGYWFFQKRGLLAALGDQDSPAPLADVQVAARREAIVATLPVVMQIVLGTAELKLSDLSRLQVGDVVLLDQAGTDGVTAVAGGRKLFRGQAGHVGSWKAFRVDSPIER